MNVLLDLDNTLISSLSKEEKRRHHNKKMGLFYRKDMKGYYTVFERPGLQNFLNFLFANFNVSVWTAATKSYALFIIRHIILKGLPSRKLDFILFSHHCTESEKLMSTQKHLDMLWSVFKIKGYDNSNTVIIDDHPDVFSTQPENCIKVTPFDFTDEKSYEDDELERKVIPLLKKLI